MSAEEGLLLDVVEHPEDDTPRLVYADWLDEHGGAKGAARAELIRVQCELARLPEEDDRVLALRRREEDLLARHGEAWVKALDIPAADYEFRRGFVEQVALGVRQFLTRADPLFRATPVRRLKLLRLTQSKVPVAEIANCPHLARVRELDLNNSSAGDERVAALLASPHLADLESLQLVNTQAGPATLRALRSANLPRLRRLNLAHNPLGSEVRALTDHPLPFRLEVLNLDECGLDSDSARRLARWPGLATVKELYLPNNPLRVAGGEHLANSRYTTGLTTLDVHASGIGVGGMRALAASSHLAGVVHLNVGGNGIRKSGVEALTASPHLRRLETLHLHTSGLDDRSAELLAGWPGLTPVRTLYLYGNDLTAQGVAALARSPHLGELLALNLNGNPVGDDGAVALAGCPRLGKLRTLDFGDCDIHSAGATAILDSPHLGRLTTLGLSANPVPAKLIKALRQRFGDV